MQATCTVTAVLILGVLTVCHAAAPTGNGLTAILCAVTVLLVFGATSQPLRPPGATFQ